MSAFAGEIKRPKTDDDPRRHYEENDNAGCTDNQEQHRAIRHIFWKRRIIRNVSVRVRVAHRRNGLWMAISALSAPLWMAFPVLLQRLGAGGDVFPGGVDEQMLQLGLQETASSSTVS